MNKSEKQPVIIQVSLTEVQAADTSRATSILQSFVPVLLERNRNRVRLEVLGYDNDPRELFDIPEVRKYFQNLFVENPSLFYWIDVDSYMLLFLGLMLFEPYRIEGQVGLRPEDMQSYVSGGFSGLNKFCESMGVSADATNDAILKVLKSWAA